MRVNGNDSSIFSTQQTKTNPLTKPLNIAPHFPTDSAQISGLGSNLAGKLHIAGDFSITDSATENDPTMKLMNRSMKEVGNLLKEMKALAEQAKDESLSDDERIDMQIQMTKLQSLLYKKTHTMSLEMAGKNSKLFNTNQLNAIDYDEKLTIKMLERERERLLNGGEPGSEGIILVEDRVQLKADKDPAFWGLTEVAYDEASGQYIPGKAKDDLGDGTALITGDKAKKLIESGVVLTDQERMAKNSLSLLDAKSAADSAGKIERRIQDLAKMQSELKEAATQNNNTVSNDTYNGTTALLDSQQAQNSVMTTLGLMQAKQAEYGQNPLKGRDLESADMRLTDTQDPMGKLFQKLDSFFKDKVHKTLGLGGMWDSGPNMTYA